MIKGALVVAVGIAALSMSACAAPAEAPPETTAPVAPTSAPVTGDGILIETRIADARSHVGEVVDGSVVGESAFCPGGTSTGSSQGATITTIFDCPDGTLTVKYAPTQFSLVQGAPWEIVSGTGSYETWQGGGSMVAAFESDNPDTGREVFTGQVKG